MKAFSLYKSAAEKGELRAQYNVGYAYQFGEGVEINMEEALIWYKKAAENGSTDAQTMLGCWYENGLGGLKVDCQEAVKWYTKAAEKGDELGMAGLGAYYLKTQDDEKAFFWLKKASEAVIWIV